MDLGARVGYEEGACAKGDLRTAWREATVTHERCLLIADHRQDRQWFSDEIARGLTEWARRREDAGQDGGGYAE